MLALEGVQFVGGRGRGSFSEVGADVGARRGWLRTIAGDHSRSDGRNIDVENVKGGIEIDVGVGKGNGPKSRAVPGIDELLLLGCRRSCVGSAGRAGGALWRFLGVSGSKRGQVQAVRPPAAALRDAHLGGLLGYVALVGSFDRWY